MYTSRFYIAADPVFAYIWQDKPNALSSTNGKLLGSNNYDHRNSRCGIQIRLVERVKSTHVLRLDEFVGAYARALNVYRYMIRRVHLKCVYKFVVYNGSAMGNVQGGWFD